MFGSLYAFKGIKHIDDIDLIEGEVYSIATGKNKRFIFAKYKNGLFYTWSGTGISIVSIEYVVHHKVAEW